MCSISDSFPAGTYFHRSVFLERIDGAGELADIQLYADWKDGRLRAALVYSFTSDQQNTSEDLFRVQFIFSNDLDGVNGSESVGWPPSTEILTDTVYGKLPVYLDAEQDRVYIAQERRIYVYDGAGDYQEQIELEPDTQIAGFLVLDDGNTVIAAERSSGKPDTDICLYQRSGILLPDVRFTWAAAMYTAWSMTRITTAF